MAVGRAIRRSSNDFLLAHKYSVAVGRLVWGSGKMRRGGNIWNISRVVTSCATWCVLHWKPLGGVILLDLSPSM